MTKHDRPLLADMKDHISSLGAELRELGTLRWQLARIEVQSAIVNGKDLVVYRAANGSLVLPIQTGDENRWEILFKRA